MPRRGNGDGSVTRLKSGRLWVRYAVEGKRVSLGTVATEAEAEKLLEETRTRLAAGEQLVEQMLSRRPRSFVYFIAEDVPGGAIKIGTGRNPARRMLALQTATPRLLRLLCVVPGSHSLEGALQAAFARARINGEWFEPVPALLALIEELRGASRAG